MNLNQCFVLLACWFAAANPLWGQDWPVWRGPTLDSHAPLGAAERVPVSWSGQQHVLWRSPVPGKGHATPIVVGKNIFLLTHEEESRTISLLKYSLSDGQPIGKVVLHRGVVPPKYLHKKNSCASGTPSSDGRAVYVVVQLGEAIYASAVSVQGPVVDGSVTERLRC
jgi:outer membrane protein assembly factor BamB